MIAREGFSEEVCLGVAPGRVRSSPPSKVDINMETDKVTQARGVYYSYNEALWGEPRKI